MVAYQLLFMPEEVNGRKEFLWKEPDGVSQGGELDMVMGCGIFGEEEHVRDVIMREGRIESGHEEFSGLLFRSHLLD